MAVSVGTMQLALLPIAIIQVPTSVAIMQLLRFYWKYVGGTLHYNYVDGSFCCNYAGECFCCNYVVRSFCSIYADENFCSKYVGDNFYWNYARGSLCMIHMIISTIVIMHCFS